MGQLRGLFYFILFYFRSYNRSYDVAKNNIIWCIWCNAMCLHGLGNIITLHRSLLLLLSAPSFWNTPIFTKLIVLRSEVCSDWSAIQCVVIGHIAQACDGNVTPLTIFGNTQRLHDNNATARLKVTPSFFAYTFGRCYKIFRHSDVDLRGHVWIRCFRKVWTSLDFINNIYLCLRL